MASLTLLNNGEVPSISTDLPPLFKITSSDYSEEFAIWENPAGNGSIVLVNENNGPYFEFQIYSSDSDPFFFTYRVLHAKPGITYINIICKVLDYSGAVVTTTTFNNVRFDIKPTIFYLKNNTKITHYTPSFVNSKYSLDLAVYTKKLSEEGFYFDNLGNFTLTRFPTLNVVPEFMQAEFEVCDLLKSIFDYKLQGRTVYDENYLSGILGSTFGGMQQLYSGFVLYFNYRIRNSAGSVIYTSPNCIAINGGISPYSDKSIFPKFFATSGFPDQFLNGPEGMPYLEKPLYNLIQENTITKANRYIALPVLNSYIPSDSIAYFIKPYSINCYPDGTKYYLPLEFDPIQLPVTNTFISASAEFNTIDFSCLLLNYTYFMYLYEYYFSSPVGEVVFKLTLESTSRNHDTTIGSFIFTNDLSGKVLLYLDELGMPQTAYFFEFFEVEQEVKRKLVENTNNTALDGTDKVFILDTDVNRTYTFRSNPLTRAEMQRYQQLLHSPSVSEIIDFARPYSTNNAVIYPEFWPMQSFRKIIILDSKTIIDKGVNPLFTLEVSFRYADNDYLTINNQWNYD